MLDYCKLILEKLSFNRGLFKKEYRKAFKHLAPHEHRKLKEWVRERFGGDVFSANHRIDGRLKPLVQKS